MSTFIARRSFLAGLGIGVGGLGLGFFASESHAAEPEAGPPKPPPTSSQQVESMAPGLNPNVFVHVGLDGAVTIVCQRSEMGQGIRSTLPVLIADELGADMARVKIVQGDGDPIYGDQNTDGSNSIRGIYEDMRRAGATPRTMLIAAAAGRWKVDPKSCTARDHQVIHEKSGRSLGFGELVADAALLKVPEPFEVVLRPREELRTVAGTLPLIDGPAYVTGTAIFGADVRLPGMLTAVIARPPVVGGKVVRYEASRALAVPGVRQVLELPAAVHPWEFKPLGGVAVLADTTWAAMRGRAALEISWDHGDNASHDSESYRRQLQAALNESGAPLRKLGDADAALASAARVIEAEYYVPHLAHVSMEPPVAVARIEGERCEVWAPTQDPQTARTDVAKALEISEDNVTMHVTFLGGGFGRKSKPDFIVEAALLAKAAGVPVRVQWTREDDIRHDYFNTVSAQRLSAGLDAQGKLVAWRHRTAFPPIASLFKEIDRPELDDLQQGVLDLAIAAPNVSAEACEARAHVRVGWLRSVYNIFHAFSVGCFIDEIAQARGEDPRATWLDVLGPPRYMTIKELGVEDLKNYGQPLEKHPVDAGRLRHVIERVTALSGWDTRKQDGRALGLAAHRSFLSYAAVVASVKLGPGDRLVVDEVWLVIDAGIVVNTDRVRSQMEGAVIFGMSLALHSAITLKGGAVEQSNFHDYRVTRIGEAPREIHVEIVESDRPPGGVGEPGVPPVAPAIANALFALTGKRVRELPLGKTITV